MVKKLKSNGIYFTGKASEEVTGSQYLVRFGKYQCLLECGLYQSSSNSYLDSYKINSEKFNFKPSEIDYVFICHPHIDHSGLIPRLVKEGFCGRIIATHKTAEIMRSLLYNSCYIISDEARILSKRYKREYEPLYYEKDVDRAIGMIWEYDEYNTVYSLNDTISFKWLHNSHCLGAAQLQLFLTDGSKTRTVLYTSDIGALNTDNHYVDSTELPTSFNDCVLMESTYGDPKRESKKTRQFDIEHLKSAIDTTLARNGSVLLPCFSFSRTQEILTTLYEIYGKDEQFKTKVVVDSRLSCDISKTYSRILTSEDLSLWKEASQWENVRFISETEDSQRCLADNSAKVVISSSGFCTNGRIVNYLKKYLRDRNSLIIFSGYTGDNPSYLSFRIKNYRDHKFISISKERVPNRADCIALTTFSNHAGYSDLIRYGSSLNTNKLILVHGDTESKKSLSDGLREAISNNNKTYKVVSASRGMIVHL